MSNDKPVPKSEQRKAAMESTRRRFLIMSSTFLGASLTGCGYGFVAPTNAPADKQLLLNMDVPQQKMLDFFSVLQTTPALQDRFIADPARTMVAAGAIPAKASVEIDRANRLLFYTLGNRSFQDKFMAILARYPSVTEVGNKYTSKNLNLDTMHAIERDLDAIPDFPAMFHEQVETLIADRTVRDILDLQIADADVPAFATRLSSSMQGLAPGERPIKPLVVVLNANLALNANAKWNINVNINTNGNLNLNANVNANWNANANWNQSTNCSGTAQWCPVPQANVAAWEQFLGTLAEHAKEVAA